MLRSCGLQFGKSWTESFLCLYHSLACPCCVTLDWSLSVLLFSSLSNWHRNTYLTGCWEDENTCRGKAPQEMGTCLLHCCSLGVRDCAKHFMALSYCIIAAILWYPCTNVIPILQMRKLAPPYHHCFGPDLLFQKQVTLSLLNPGSRYCQTWPGWSLWNWTPGQECNPFVSRNLMRLMRYAVWVPLRF